MTRNHPTGIRGTAPAGGDSHGQPAKPAGAAPTAKPPAPRTTPAEIVGRNRRNARGSTGPRTRLGKTHSRWNALKDGLLAREVLIPTGVGKEDPAQLNVLLAELRTEFEPVGVLEEILVEKIAIIYWRSRRVLRAEIGEIQRKLEFSSYRAGVEWMAHLESDNPPPGADPLVASDRLRGIIKDLATLDFARRRIESDGGLTPEFERRLLEDSGKNPIAAQIVAVASSRASDGGAEDSPDPAAATARLLDVIDRNRAMLETAMDAAAADSGNEFTAMMRASRARFHLPAGEAAERIRMYDVTLDRQFYRALHELERIQRRRKGDYVPAPAQVDVRLRT